MTEIKIVITEEEAIMVKQYFEKKQDFLDVIQADLNIMAYCIIKDVIKKEV